MWMKPLSSSPTMLSAGTLTSSKNSSAVSDSSWPTLSSLRPREKPSASASTAKRVMPLRLLLRVGAGGDEDQVGGVAVGDEGLRAVDDVVVAVLDGRRLQRGEVGAAGRLGHPDRGQDLAGAEAGEPALLLLLGGQVHEVRRHDVAVDAHARGQRHVDPGQLLGEHRVEAVVAGPGPAVLLGDLEPQEPLLAGLDPEVPRDGLLGDVLLQVRGDLAVQELLDRRAERLVVLVVDRALHGPILLPGNSRCSGEGLIVPIDGYSRRRAQTGAGNRGGTPVESWPGTPYPLGATLRRQRHQLRAVQRGGRAGRAVPHPRRGRGAHGGADRAHRGGRVRLALLPADGAAGAALRLPRPRTLGSRARAAVQPQQAAPRPLRQGHQRRHRLGPVAVRLRLRRPGLAQRRRLRART